MSQRYDLDTTELKSVLKRAGLAAIGAVSAYVTGLVVGHPTDAWLLIVAAAWSVAANLLRKFLTTN